MHNRIKALVVAAIFITNTVSPTVKVLANELQIDKVNEEITTTISTEEKTEDNMTLDMDQSESSDKEENIEENAEDSITLDVNESKSDEKEEITEKEEIINKEQSIHEKTEQSLIQSQINISEENSNAVTKGVNRLGIESNKGTFDWGYSTSNEVAIEVAFDNTTNKKVVEIELAEGMAFDRYPVIGNPSHSVESEATPTDLSVLKDVLEKPTQDSVTGQYSGKLVYQLEEGVASGKIVVNVSVDRYKYYGAKEIQDAIKVTVKENDSEVSFKSRNVQAEDNTNIGAKNNSLNYTSSGRTTQLQPGGSGETYSYYRNTTSTIQTGDNGVRDFTFIKSAELTMYYPVNTKLVSVNKLPSGATYTDYPSENKVVITMPNSTIQNSNVSLTYEVDSNAPFGIANAPNKNTMVVTYYDDTTETLTAQIADSIEIVDPNLVSSVIEMTVQDGYYHDYEGKSLSISGFIYLQDKTIKEYKDQVFEYNFSNWNTRKVLLPDSMTGIKNIKYKLYGDTKEYTVDNNSLVNFQGAQRLIDADVLRIAEDKYFEKVTFEVENIPVGFDDSANGRNNKLAISFGELPKDVNEGSTTVKIYSKGNEASAITTVRPIKRVNKPEKIAISAANTSLRNDAGTEVSNSFTQQVLKVKTSFDANKGFNRIYNFSNYLENPEIIIRMPKGFHLSTQTIKLTQNGDTKNYTISEHESSVDGAKIYTLQTEDVKIGGFEPKTLAINPAINIEFDFVTDSTVNGKYNLNDMVFIGKKGSHIDEVYANSGLLVQNDNFDLIKGDNRSLGRTQTKEFEIIETNDLVVTTHVRDHGSPDDKNPYNKDDESTAIQVSKGTLIDFIVKVENNYERNAEDFEVYIPIPKKGINMGPEVQIGDFNWDMELQGDAVITVKDKDGNVVNVSDLFEVTYGYNANGGSSYSPNYTTDKDVIRVVAKREIEPGISGEIKFTFKAADSAGQSEVGTLNVFNGYYRRKYDNGTIDIRLPGNYVGLRLAIGQIKGIAFLDKNNDGLYNNPADEVLKDIVVQLWDKATNTLLKETVTDSNGEYSFEGLSNGEYDIKVINNYGSLNINDNNAKRFTKVTALSGDSYKNDSDIESTDNVNGSISISIPTKSYVHDINDYVNIGFVKPVSISVQTDGNGILSGSNIGDYKVWPFTKIQKPTTVTPNAGYTFVNYTNLATGAEFDFQSEITSDTTIQANFKKNIYTITLDANDGTDGTKTSIEVVFDESIKAGLDLLTGDELPTRTGYKFVGWAKDKDGNNLITDADKMGTTAITVYAIWEKEVYTIDLDANGGVDGSKTQVEVAFEGKIKDSLDSLTADELPTRTGYKFVGWSTTEDVSGLITYTHTMGAASITLYAIWEKEVYTIDLDANGGVDGSKTQLEVAFEDKIKDSLDSLTADELPTRTGYKFVGWSTTEDISGLITDTHTMGAASITLYAIWEKEEYTITLDANDGTDGTKTSIKVAFNESIQAGLNSLTGNELPTRTGYKLVGWSTTKDGNNLITDANLMGTTPITVYAVWEKVEYTITLDANGGADGTKTQLEVAFEGKIKDSLDSLTANELPTRTGYKFVGWSTTNDVSGLITDTHIMGATSITLYAIWDKAPEIIGVKDTLITARPDFDLLDGITAKDGEDQNLTIEVNKGNFDPSVPGVYEIIYTVKDTAGNITEEKRKITVDGAPVIEGVKDTLITARPDFDLLDGITAKDGEDQNLTIEVNKGNFDPSVPGVYEIIYTVKDTAGNITEEKRVITVDGAPVIEGVVDTTIKAGDEFNPLAGITAEDAEDQNLEIKVSGDEVLVDTPGKYNVIYTVTDSAGNVTTVTRVITVDGAPVIEGVVDTTIKAGEEFNPLTGITAEDAEDQNLEIKVSGDEVLVDTPGKYNVIYTVTDSAGNVTTVTRVVTVDGAPVITGATDITLNVGSKFDPLAGVVATDTEGGNLTESIEVSGDKVDVNKPGKYTITYTVTDDAGNVTTVDRIVIIEEAPTSSGSDNYGDSEENKPEEKPQEQEKPVGNQSINSNSPNTGDKGMLSYLLLSMTSMIGLVKGIKRKKE